MTVRKTSVKKGSIAMKFSIVPLLLGGESISPEIKEALREKRLRDAAQLIMRQYGLSCVEAGQLLDVSACDR
jgi:hypothetical protein